MKKVLWIAAVLSLAVLSCKKPGCIDPEAENYNSEAKTDDGTCVYPPDDHRLSTLGYYLMKDSVFVDGAYAENRTYTVQVRLQSGEEELSDKIIIEGLFGTDHTYYGNVNKAFEVDFPAQEIGPGAGINFTGTGSFLGQYFSYTMYHSYVDGETTYNVRTKARGDK